MKTTKLKVGARYRMDDGRECTVVSITGRGRHRAVRTEPALSAVGGINRYWRPIKAFAAQVAGEVGGTP